MALDIRPEFQVEYIEGEFEVPITTIEPDVKMVGHHGDKKITINRMKHGTRIVTAGYMLYFPQKHSMFIAIDDVEQIERLGIKHPPRRVDMNSGEVVPDGFDLSPKELVARAESNRPRPPSKGGLDDI